jgi:hypothetical protein
VTCRVANAVVRNTGWTVHDISKHATAPLVTTNSAHGYNVGDFVVHGTDTKGWPDGGILGQAAPSGMTQIHGVICRVMSTPTSTTYTIGDASGNPIDSTGFGTFTIDGGYTYQYCSLTRGSTGEYPILLNDGLAPLGTYALTISANQYVTFVFDPDIQTVAPVQGAWIVRKAGLGVCGGAVPLEHIAKFMIEFNAQKGGDPTHCWVCLPTRGMTTMYSSGYNSAENYAVGLADVLKNPSSTLRTNGWPVIPTNIKLFIEHSNESWNTGFPNATFQQRLNFQRFATNNVSSFSSFAAVKAMRDIKAAFPSLTDITYVLGGQGSNGTGYPNDIRINGGSEYTTLIGSAITPLSEFDAFATASYFDTWGGTGAWDNAHLVTQALAWAGHAGNPTAQEADCAVWVDGLLHQAQSGNDATDYYGGLIAGYDTACGAQGKIYINYEGGWNHATGQNGQSGWNSAWNSNGQTVSSFLLACKNSQAWAIGVRALYYDVFNTKTHSFYPAAYILIGPQWGNTPILAWNSNAVDSYAGGVEGGNFDQSYFSLARRNNGLSYP